MHPHHPADTDEGAGSLTVTDGAFGGEDWVSGPSLSNCGGGVMVAASVKFGVSEQTSMAEEAYLGLRRQLALGLSSLVDQATGY